MRQFITIVSIILAVSMIVTACNDQDHYLINIKQQTSEKVEELERGTANIVWVVDMSGSMGVHIDNVKSNAGAFTDLLEEMEIEFTLGAIRANGQRIGPPIPSDVGRFEGTPQVLTNRTPDWKTLFVDNFPRRTNGIRDEEMLAAAWALFDPTRLTQTPWMDFYTPGSHLFLIVVSDTDDDNGPISPEQLADRLKSVYPEDHIHYYGFLCMTDKDCDSEWTEGNPQANRVVQLGNYVEAQFFEKSDEDYSPHLRTIAERIVQLVSMYELKSLPIVETLTVEVNGKVLDSSRKNGWTYDQDHNAVVFHGSATPRQDDDIQVRYKPELLQP